MALYIQPIEFPINLPYFDGTMQVFVNAENSL